MGKPYELRAIEGIAHKHCRGPIHPEEGVWLSVAMFGTRTDNGRLRGCCKRCEHFYRWKKLSTHVGWLPIKQFQFAIFELERRLGRIEAQRRVGVGKATWYRWIGGSATTIQAAKAVKLIETLSDVRNANEVRHKKSIRRGASARGELEKIPTAREHYYKPHGDDDSRHKRNSRARVG